MSELKAIRGGDIHDDVEFGYGDEDRASFLYYRKSETDKVIAELKAQKAQLEDDMAFWKNKYKECKRELDLLKDTNAFYNGEKNG